MPFTSRYNTAMLNSIARDDKLYCLPCSAQVRDIVYNTILFEEKGWKVPYDFNRFIALCRTIGARGIRSIHLGFVNTFQTMIDTGVWKKSDLSLTYAERETMLFNRQCAMVEDSVLMARRGGTPSPAPPISSRSCLSSAPAPLATGTASIWCVISI